MNRSSALLLLLCACFTTLAGCRVEVSSDSDEEASPNSVDLGLEEGITASKVLSGLNNPAGVSFSPRRPPDRLQRRPRSRPRQRSRHHLEGR